jgi:hypothetical protein
MAATKPSPSTERASAKVVFRMRRASSKKCSWRAAFFTCVEDDVLGALRVTAPPRLGPPVASERPSSEDRPLLLELEEQDVLPSLLLQESKEG